MNKDEGIDRKEEIQIAFNIWELIAQLETLLWDRYFDEFNEILCSLEKERFKDINKLFHL